MGYYRGDYYQGDYYQGGIPGLAILAGVAKKVLPRIVRGAVGLLRGGRKVGKVLARHPLKTTVGVGLGAEALSRRIGQRGRMERVGGRRMNVTNVKALRRAGRRVRGFLKLASRLGALPVNRGKGRRLFKRKARR